MAYADLMKMQADWKYGFFKRKVDEINRAKTRACLLAGVPNGTAEAYQVIDGRKRFFFRGGHNTLLYNWMAKLASFYDQGAVSSQEVDINGTAHAQFLDREWFPTSTANGQLGSDMATATNKGFWKLVSAITHTAPTVSVGGDVSSITEQGVSYNARLDCIIGLTFPTNATTGNPTIGEIAPLFYQNVTSTTNADFIITRLAAADGTFTAFTIDSTLALSVNYKLAV